MATVEFAEIESGQLWREFDRTRDVHLRNKIVLRHLGLVKRLAREAAARTSEPVEDLEQEGCLGLIKAVERFRPERGVRFSSYAFPVITGALKNYLRRRRPLVPLEELSESDLPGASGRSREQPTDPALLEHLLQAPKEDFTLTVVDRLATERLLQRLPPLEQEVIRHFFYVDLTQREVARVVARSSSRVSRILRQALSALKEAALEEEREGAGDGSLPVVDRETGLFAEQQLRRTLERERLNPRPGGSALAIFRFLRRPTPQALRRFGQMASEQARVVDQAFRLGAEQVAILFPETAEGTRVACKRLQAKERRATKVTILEIAAPSAQRELARFLPS